MTILNGRPASFDAKAIVYGLACVSLALGVVELLFPRRFLRRLGAPGREGWIRLVGACELVAGVALIGAATSRRSAAADAAVSLAAITQEPKTLRTLH